MTIQTPFEPRASVTLLGDPTPMHEALRLTGGGSTARIVLDGQIYTLRITRAGKLILTK